MPAPKRKVKAKTIVRNIREGMSDDRLMEKFSLSPRQLKKIFGQLIDGGFIHEMELFERTSLSESMVTRAYVEARQAIGELEVQETKPPEVMQEIDPKAEIEFTEVIDIDQETILKMLERGRL